MFSAEDIGELFQITPNVVKAENSFPSRNAVTRALFYCEKAMENREIGEGDLRFITSVLKHINQYN